MTDHESRPGDDEVREEVGDETPTVSKPIHGEPRPAFKPLLITVGVFAVLIVLYLLGAQFLVPAD